jgi:hypothetical protein
MKLKVAILPPLNRYSLRDFLTKNVLCLKKIENEKKLLSSFVSISSCVTSLCNNNRCDKVGDDENEINEENDLSTTLKRGTKKEN